MNPENNQDNAFQTVQNQPANIEIKSNPEHSTALEVVLQWLTYVFWFWNLAVISIVLSATLAYIFVEQFEATWISYVASSLIVLLPAAAATDYYYKKIEPSKKRGFAAVIMVINAVIACIYAVGSMIAAVVSGMSMIIGTGKNDGKAVTLMSSLVVAFLSLLFFLRVIHVEKLRLINQKFSLITAAVVGLAFILMIFGPLTGTIKRKNDTLIENNYYSIRSQIEDYVRKNKALPNSLSDVSFEDGAKEAIETGKVSYSKTSNKQNDLFQNNKYSGSQTKYEYEICVDWDYKSGTYNSRYDSGRYYGSSHEKGKQCYQEDSYIY